MQNSGLFQIIHEKYQTPSGNTKTRKTYLFLESFTYSKSLEYIKQYQALLKRYSNLNNLALLEFNFKLGAYETFTSGKNRLLLYPLKGEVQKGSVNHDYIN